MIATGLILVLFVILGIDLTESHVWERFWGFIMLIGMGLMATGIFIWLLRVAP